MESRAERRLGALRVDFSFMLGLQEIGHMLQDSIYRKCAEEANPQKQRVDSWGGVERVMAKRDGISFGGDRNVFKIACGNTNTLYLIVHLKTNLLTPSFSFRPLCPLLLPLT